MVHRQPRFRALLRLLPVIIFSLGLLAVKYDLLCLSIDMFSFTCGYFVNPDCMFLSVRLDLCD
jgi:hypothetical protein